MCLHSPLSVLKYNPAFIWSWYEASTVWLIFSFWKSIYVFSSQILWRRNWQAFTSPVASLNPALAEKIWALKLATRASCFLTNHHRGAPLARHRTPRRPHVSWAVDSLWKLVLADSYRCLQSKQLLAGFRPCSVNRPAAQTGRILCTAAVTTSSAAKTLCLLVSPLFLPVGFVQFFFLFLGMIQRSNVTA